MIFEFNSKTYRVDFIYAVFDKNEWNADRKFRNKIHLKRMKTVCQITERLSPGKYLPLTSGEAFCHKKDTFKKSIGRRHSLQEATKLLGNKPLQVEIWNQYFSQHNDSEKDGISNISI